jgi:hypothetical protein
VTYRAAGSGLPPGALLAELFIVIKQRMQFLTGRRPTHKLIDIMLGTRPRSTGSLVIATMGMVGLASLKGVTIQIVIAKTKSGLRSAASRAICA